MEKIGEEQVEGASKGYIDGSRQMLIFVVVNSPEDMVFEFTRRSISGNYFHLCTNSRFPYREELGGQSQ